MEVRDAAVATDQADGAERDHRELSLNLGEACPEGEQLCDGRSAVSRLVELTLDFVGGGVAVEVEELPVHHDRTTTRDRKPRSGDLVVPPVILTGGDHLLERLPEIDGETADARREVDRRSEGRDESVHEGVDDALHVRLAFVGDERMNALVVPAAGQKPFHESECELHEPACPGNDRYGSVLACHRRTPFSDVLPTLTTMVRASSLSVGYSF